MERSRAPRAVRDEWTAGVYLPCHVPIGPHRRRHHPAVTVDLGRVGVGGEQDVGRAVGPRHPEHGVDDRPRQEVGQHDLLHEPDRDERHAGAELHVGGIPRRGELGQELPRAHDRPGHEVREERQVDRRVEQGCRRDEPAAHVHDVGDRLEGEEAHPHRQREREQRQGQAEPQRVEHPVDVGGEEAVVLEEAEDAEVDRHRQRDDPLRAARIHPGSGARAPLRAG